jgi:glucose/arabinose dehydrogenase
MRLAVRTHRTRVLTTLITALLALNAIPVRAQQARPARKPAPPANTEKSIRTAFYTFTMTTQPALLPAPDRRRAGGSIAVLGDGFLVVTAIGDFYRLSWVPNGNTLRAQKLPLSVPFNRLALLKESGEGAAAPFRITDLLVDERGDAAELYVAHHYWDPVARCVTLRVSSTTLPAAGTPAVEWKTLFDSQPCLPVGEMWPMGEQADRSGGRLARHERGILLTIGDHGFDGLEGVDAFPLEPGNSYGKIVLIDEAGSIIPFSIGHRNQQGLAIDTQGRIWSTEHGPEGGDELNLIVEGGNYGWPLASYGAEYGTDNWPFAVNARNHGEYREPAHAFVPSIGISQLIQITSKYLPRWTDDLLIASLQAGRVFRVRVSGDQVIYTEAIDLNTRIRDLVEARNGRIVLWNDDGQVATLALAPTPAPAK